MYRQNRFFAFGNNADGGFGIGNVNTQTSMVQVSNLGSNIVSVKCSIHCIALTNTNTIVSWGMNNYGQLGTGSAGSTQSTPVSVSLTNIGSKTIAFVDVSYYASYLLTTDGYIFAWG
jgi:alpha-tubulin suppressor-like RCC1 family protein